MGEAWGRAARNCWAVAPAALRPLRLGTAAPSLALAHTAACDSVPAKRADKVRRAALARLGPHAELVCGLDKKSPQVSV